MTPPRCAHAECSAAPLDDNHCVEHITESRIEHVAAALREARHPVDCRDARITSDRLQCLLRAVACADLVEGEDGTPIRRLPCPVLFDRATFRGFAVFDGLDFRCSASFEGARFTEDTSFLGATFREHADFDDVTFEGSAGFTRAIFDDHAGFQGARFLGHARFDGARLRSYADFEGSRFSHWANFSGATFQLARRLGPLVVDGRLVFDECVFAERVHIEVASTTLSARAATFADGVHLRVRWAEIALDNADFARASTLTGATGTWPLPEDVEPVLTADNRRLRLEPRPRLVTLRGAQVAGLSLSDVDLRACRFFGAHDLHSLSIEASCRWPRAPGARRSWRYRDRETIAEEHHQRGWGDPATNIPAWLEGRDDGPELEPAQLAGLYRALRKAREDAGDQAGANDHYFGEMEMRRHSKPMADERRARVRVGCDRSVLFGYWLLSGYGLKASRALLALIAAIGLAAYGFHEWGFDPDPSGTRALLYSAETASGLFRTPTAPPGDVTELGEVIQMAMRLVGPLLIGLALLAIRARVKR